MLSWYPVFLKTPRLYYFSVSVILDKMKLLVHSYPQHLHSSQHLVSAQEIFVQRITELPAVESKSPPFTLWGMGGCPMMQLSAQTRRKNFAMHVGALVPALLLSLGFRGDWAM